MERDYMSVNLKTLKLGGVWNYFEHSRFLRLKVRLYHFFMVSVAATMMIHSITMCTEILTNLSDVESLGADGRIALTFLPATLKQLFFLQRKEKVKEMIDVLRRGAFATKLRWTKEHEEIVNRANLYTRIISWSYYVFGILSVGLFAVSALTTSYKGLFGTTYSNETVPKKLINGAWYPFDIQKPGYYILAFSFQAYADFVGPALNIGIDTLIVSLLVHSRGQFQLLKYSLRTIKDRVKQVLISNKRHLKNAKEDNNDLKIFSVYEDDIEREISDMHGEIDLRNGQAEEVALKSLKECIEHHQILLKFLDDIQLTFGPMFFCQFFFSSCALILCLFTVIKALSGDMGGTAESVGFFLLSTLQLVLYCWYGNELTHESNTLADAMYDTPWYETSINFRRCLLTMMYRTTHICILKAGFLNRISMETFISIMKASFSYYTILSERIGA